MNDTILEVKDLSVTFTQYERGFSRRTIHAVEKMDLRNKVVRSSRWWIQRFGKKSAAHAIMGILPYNSEMDGEIRFLGEPLTEKKVKSLRGHEIGSGAPERFLPGSAYEDRGSDPEREKRMFL